jgi:hypothetical protein
VLSENWVGLKHPDLREVRAPLPRPEGLGPAEGVLPVAWAGAETADGGWALMLQSEWGDVYRVEVEEGSPPELSVRVLGWLPPSTALASFGAGKLLWAAAEQGEQALCKVEDQGKGKGKGGTEARVLREEGKSGKERVGDGPGDAAKVAPVFSRAAGEGRLSTVVREEGVGNVTRLLSFESKLVALGGRGPASCLRMLGSGLPVVEHLQAPLPVGPVGMWAVGEQYIVLAFASTTLVLEVGSSLTQVRDRGFILDARTIEVGGSPPGRRALGLRLGLARAVN